MIIKTNSSERARYDNKIVLVCLKYVGTSRMGKQDWKFFTSNFHIYSWRYPYSTNFLLCSQFVVWMVCRYTRKERNLFRNTKNYLLILPFSGRIGMVRSFWLWQKKMCTFTMVIIFRRVFVCAVCFFKCKRNRQSERMSKIFTFYGTENMKVK